MNNRIQFRLIALLLAFCVCVSLSGCAVEIDGEKIPAKTTELDLSGRGLTDVSQLIGLKKLQKLDIRGNYITAEQFDELSAALPECDILWSVPIGMEYYDSDVAEFSKAADYVDDLYNIRYFTNVSECDVTGTNADDERLYRLAVSMTDIEVNWTVILGGEEYPTTTVTLDLSGTRFDDYNFLKYFRHLKELRFSSDQIADCSSFEMLTELETLSLKNNALNDISALSAFSELRELDLSYTSGNQVKDLSPLGKLDKLENVNLMLCGGENFDAVIGLPALRVLDLSYCLSGEDVSMLAGLSPTIEELKLDNCDVTSGDLSCLSRLTSLKKLSLHFNNISDPSALYSLTSLEELTIDKDNISAAKLSELQKALPNCKIKAI